VPLHPVDTDRYIRDLDFLSDVTRETLSSLQLGPLLRRVVRLMRDRFGYDYAAVALVEEEKVVFKAGSGGHLDKLEAADGTDPPWQVSIGEGIVGTCVTTGLSKLVNDVSVDSDYIKLDTLASTASELAVPLIHQDDVLGVLDVQSNLKDAFNETDVRLLEIVSALVAPAVRSAALHERWRRRMRYLHLLGEISRMVMTSLTQENVIEVACDVILEALDISFVGIALLDPNNNQVIHAGHATGLSFLPERRFNTAVGRSVVGQVVAGGESVRVGNVEAFEGFIHVVPGMRSALCVPLRIRDHVIGALEVEHSRLEHFTEEDQRHLENLSAYLAQALENARLFDGQRRRWQQLLVINETARIATESLELDEILEQVAKEVHDRFSYFAVGVMLREEQEVVLKALKCDEELDLPVGHREPLGAGVAGRVTESGEVLQFGRADQYDRAIALRGDIQSILCVPLCSQAGVIGVIEVQGLEQDAFDSDDRLVMETLAKSVAGAIANASSIQHAEQIREDLNRMIVHDLRNPVQAVLYTLQEIQRGSAELLPEKARDSVTEGVTCTEDILDMVNSLLDVSRFEAGKAQLRLTPAALNDHVRGAVRRLAPIARSKGIQVTTVLSQEVPVVRVDHELLDRTMTNLVSNALKFTPDGARITIRTEMVDDADPSIPTKPPCVLVVVQDTGEGIPPAYQDKIFEKFGQVESRKAGLKMSTGLGLTLCRYVVKAHGGDIWVESTVGKGSKFKFTIPCKR
jgi:two-component system, NtrC family, sensor histidine kinase KinB